MGKKYLDIFCRQTEAHIASLQRGLLVLDQNPTRRTLVQELLRNVHTIKGSAGMLELTAISDITGRMAELLRGMESASCRDNTAVIGLLFEGAEAVAQITSSLARKEQPQLDVERFVAAYRLSGESQPTGGPTHSLRQA